MKFSLDLFYPGIINLFIDTNQILTYCYDDFIFELYYITDVTRNHKIPDYSTMTPEELFQISTVYDLPLKLSTMIELQLFLKTVDVDREYNEYNVNIDDINYRVPVL